VPASSREAKATEEVSPSFFPTLAAQLVKREPIPVLPIKSAIDNGPSTFANAIREQFEKLIPTPFNKISQDSRKVDNLVIVIDALDECERDEDIRIMVNLFSCFHALQSPRLRVGPNCLFRLGFSAVEGAYQGLILYELPRPVIEHDISAYLKHELVKIGDDGNRSNQKTNNQRQ
jgi:hypothetical protein